MPPDTTPISDDNIPDNLKSGPIVSAQNSSANSDTPIADDNIPDNLKNGPPPKQDRDVGGTLIHHADIIERGATEGAANALGTGIGFYKGIQDLGPYLAHETVNGIRKHFGGDPLPNPYQNPFSTIQSGANAASSLVAPVESALGNNEVPETVGEQREANFARAAGGSLVAPGSAPANIAAGLTSEAAREIAESHGYGPLGQLAAAAAGGMVAPGTAAGVRGLVRGGSEGAANMQANIQQAQDLKIPQTMGQAAESSWLQNVENSLRRLWGGGRITKVGAQQAQGIENKVASLVQQESKGAPVTPESTGDSIKEGSTRYTDTLRKQEEQGYQAVQDTLPQGDNRIAANQTSQFLSNITKPIAGAPKLGEVYTSSNMKNVADAFNADATRSYTPSQLQAGIEPTNNISLPYSALRAVRTKVGDALANMSEDSPDYLNTKRLYGAMSEDLRQGIVSMGDPKLTKLANDADAMYRVHADARENLSGIVDKAGGGEAIYQAATNKTTAGATKLRAVMNALDSDPAAQGQLRGSLIYRLGKKSADPNTDDFSAPSFFKNYGNMAPEAKDAAFGKSSQLRQDMDTLNDAWSRLSSGPILGGKKGALDIVGRAGHAAGAAAVIGLLAEHAGALIQGHPVTAGVGAAAIGGNMVVSRALTSPSLIHWMAQTTKLPPGAFNNALNQLGAMKDPDAQELYKALKSQMQANNNGT